MQIALAANSAIMSDKIIPSEVSIDKFGVSRHAFLSPSGGTRWTVCAAAPKMGSKMPNKGSYAASEGSVAHEIVEMILKDRLDGVTVEDYWLDKVIPYEEEEIIVTQEIIDIAKFYCDYVKERKEELNAEMLIEQQLNLTEICSEIWGTSDCILLAKDRIVIIDFKAGKWQVDVDDNIQLKIYSLMALQRYPDKSEVEMVIVQPRGFNKEGKVRSRTMKAENLVDWGFNWLQPKAEKCLLPDDELEYVAGKHCHFCNYKPECKTHKIFKEEQDEQKRQNKS